MNLPGPFSPVPLIRIILVYYTTNVRILDGMKMVGSSISTDSHLGYTYLISYVLAKIRIAVAASY